MHTLQTYHADAGVLLQAATNFPTSAVVDLGANTAPLHDEKNQLGTPFLARRAPLILTLSHSFLTVSI